MIIFLYGEDSFRSLDKLKELKNRFQKEVDPTGSSIAEVEGGEVDLAYVRKVVLAPALFVKERFVVFKNFLKEKPSEDLQDDLIKLLKDYTGKKDDNIIIFWEEAEEKKLDTKTNPLFKFLKKQKFSQEFKSMSDGQVKKWIKDELKKKETDISDGAMRLLLELVDSDTWALNNEVNKLAGYKQGQTIEEEDVRLLVSGKEDENVYHLLDMIVAKNPQGALSMLGNILSGQDGESTVLNILKWHINAIVNIKACLEGGMKTPIEISKETGVHQFVVKKNKIYAERLSLEELEKILKLTIDLEMDLRKQKAPVKVLFTDYVMELVK